MTQTATMTRHMTRSISHVDSILPNRRDDAADEATIKLLTEVIALRTQLRALEPQLSKMITDYGFRRGQTGYREFYLRSELNAQAYKER